MSNISYKLKMDPIGKIKLRRCLESNGRAQKFFTHEVRRLADPYVPFRKGPLKNTAREDVSSITYIQPYDKRKCLGNRGNGKRGKMWIPRMWADRGKEIIKSVADYAGGHPK